MSKRQFLLLIITVIIILAGSLVIISTSQSKTQYTTTTDRSLNTQDTYLPHELTLEQQQAYINNALDYNKNRKETWVLSGQIYEDLKDNQAVLVLPAGYSYYYIKNSHIITPSGVLAYDAIDENHRYYVFESHQPGQTKIYFRDSSSNHPIVYQATVDNSYHIKWERIPFLSNNQAAIRIADTNGTPTTWTYTIKNKKIIDVVNDLNLNFQVIGAPMASGGTADHYYFLQAKKPGNTQIIFKLTSTISNEIYETQTYQIQVDNNLNINISKN